MSDCILVDGRCAHCGWQWSGTPAVRRNCPARKPPAGAGAQLSRLLARLGVKDAAGCRCRSHAAVMDLHGTWWCLRHLRTIAAWLGAEAGRRGWRWPRAVTLAACPVVLLAIALAAGRALFTTKSTKRD